QAKDAENKTAKEAEELKEAKAKAKEEIDKLSNLSGDEKDGYNNQVKEKTTKGDVEQVVKDAQAKDAENKTAKEAEELKDAKAKAKEAIDKLPNLSKVEKDGYNNQVKEKTTKEDVAQVVKDAQAKDAANKVQPGQDQPAQVQPGQGNSNNATTPTAFSSGRSYISLTKSNVKNEEKKTVTLEAVMTIGSRKLTRIIDGKAQEITMDVAAYIEQDRTYIPMRYVGESLGFDVSWDAANRMAILKNKNKEVKISVDSNIFYVNGEKFESDVKPQIKNDRTMIPVGNFARAIGLKDGEGILWGASKREVRIKQEIEL
ncbi:copper amine oxidase N-terminal domain-containing protein, partial [Aedoeadaptatus coxii]|uniref:copper amine oxidase N-terminal domain-containing protein n=1 Tax=Aedoeadaptatus coxii TaxID=755172 RepID=UPI002AD53198